MKKYIAFGALLAVSMSCTDTEYIDREIIVASPGEASISFDARYGDADFELNKPLDFKLNNESGEFDLQYEFSRLRYWVSNVTLITEQGEEFLVPNSYYLIEENNPIPVQDGSFDKVYPANKREEVVLTGIPVGDYKAVKFHVGVEPKYNDNLTLQVGELTPLNGMAKDNWMWFTSYIFTSISGKMTWVKSEPESKNFFWETGSNEFYGQKEIQFDQPITISSENSSKINLELDVKKVIEFDLPWVNNVIGATNPELMETLTTNYLESFTLKSAESTAK